MFPLLQHAHEAIVVFRTHRKLRKNFRRLRFIHAYALRERRIRMRGDSRLLNEYVSTVAPTDRQNSCGTFFLTQLVLMKINKSPCLLIGLHLESPLPGGREVRVGELQETRISDPGRLRIEMSLDITWIVEQNEFSLQFPVIRTERTVRLRIEVDDIRGYRSVRPGRPCLRI